MKKSLAATNTYFESAPNRTPQYLAWYRLFKREFTKFLTGKGAKLIEINKPNHFDMSGFFTMGNQIWYFSISDLRWCKDSMLVRTAQSYRDYTGGQNQFVSLTNEDIFDRQFTSVVK